MLLKIRQQLLPTKLKQPKRANAAQKVAGKESGFSEDCFYLYLPLDTLD